MLYCMPTLSTAVQSSPTSPSIRAISFDDWLEEYKPIANPNGSAEEYKGLLFDVKDEFVLSHAESNVWTLIECDNLITVIPGLHYVNRQGFFITAIPFESLNDEFEVQIHSIDDELDFVLDTFHDTYSIQSVPGGQLLLKDANDPSDGGEDIPQEGAMYTFNVGIVTLKAELNKKGDRAFVTGTLANGKPSRRITIMIEKQASI